MDEKEYIDNIPMWARKKASLDQVKKNIEFFHIRLPRIIHVAGTNGKGSVCAYLSNILMAGGKKVATFISPHLKEVNERILFQMQPITDEELSEISKFVRETLKNAGENISPTYFEYLFYIAMVYFSRKSPDYIILETGLGGRLDVTNIFENTCISIITSIGMDHMQYLGNSIEDIAYEKAGIIKENSVVIFDDSNIGVNKIILKKAENEKTKSIPLSSFNYKALDFTDVEYKKKAAGLAILAAKYLGENAEDLDTVLKNTVWHGRMEEIKKDVFLDGAHNEPAIIEFIKNAAQISESKNKKIKLLISIVKDKEYGRLLDILTKGLDVKKYYLTKISSDRTSDTDVLKNILVKNLNKNGKNSQISCFNNTGDAFFTALNEKTEDEILFCVGSLYLIGEVLEEVYDRF